MGYMEVQGVTKGYRGYKGLLGVLGGYKGLQGVTSYPSHLSRGFSSNRWCFI